MSRRISRVMVLFAGLSVGGWYRLQYYWHRFRLAAGDGTEIAHVRLAPPEPRSLYHSGSGARSGRSGGCHQCAGRKDPQNFEGQYAKVSPYWEASGRTRVIVNLIDLVAYTVVSGNTLLMIRLG